MTNSFDIAAPLYDETFTHSQIGKYQRQHVYTHLSRLLQKFNPTTILEINCGTGEDALWLARQNYNVTATDISPKMIDAAKSKAKYPNLHFKQADINELPTHFPYEEFEMIFSNFGGLNCLTESEMLQFFKNANQLLAKDGIVVLVVMPKNTLWEQMYFFAKGQFSNVLRRKKNNIIADVNGQKVPTYYYNPNQLISFANGLFEQIQVKPIGLFLPPSYLEPFFKNKPRLMSALNKLENGIEKFDSTAKYADHYFIAFQKR